MDADNLKMSLSEMSINRYKRQVVDKISQVLVQLVAVLRNFSTDGGGSSTSGRSQLLNYKIVCRLCSLQGAFAGYPDLLLNCARVTAKLSLLDPFRAQINSRPQYIRSIVGVVLQEADGCARLMDGTAARQRDGTYASTPSIEKSTIKKLEKSLLALSLHLSHCLFHENEEVVLETARVLGNLTRRKHVLDSIVANRTDEALILLLGHVNIEIVSAVTGALVNMSADFDSRQSLLRPDVCMNLMNSFTNILRKVSFKDISLSTLICQALHNLLAPMESKAKIRNDGGGGDED
eukprot:gene34222-44208_t